MFHGGEASTTGPVVGNPQIRVVAFVYQKMRDMVDVHRQAIDGDIARNTEPVLGFGTIGNQTSNTPSQ